MYIYIIQTLSYRLSICIYTQIFIFHIHCIYTCLYESCLCRQFKFLYRLSICLHRYKFAEVQEKNQFKTTIMHFIGLLCNIMQEVQFPQNMKKLAKVNLILDKNVLQLQYLPHPEHSHSHTNEYLPSFLIHAYC